MSIRTDLAFESKDFYCSSKNISDFPGVISKKKNFKGFEITTVKVTDDEGEKAIGKPKGCYITFEADPLLMREKDSFENACNLIKDILKDVLPDINGTALIVGLGNQNITSDALGPYTLKNTIVTRHLIEKIPEYFGEMRSVAAIAPGVLSTTGFETEEIISTIAKNKDISLVIAIDALASRSIKRLCRTVQISDTGISPGSGVGNHRRALNRETLGVPVIAIGVPTVVYASTLAYDVAVNAGIEVSENSISTYSRDLLVTPRDIDENIKDMAKLIGYGINLSLQDITIEDINMLLS